MPTSISDNRLPDVPHITLVGAGNLATQLGKALRRVGCVIPQVYSRTMRSAATLAELLQAQPVDDLTAIRGDVQLLIVAVADKALPDVLASLHRHLPDVMTAHTAGSMPLAVYGEEASRCGVFYPMQTFSKSRDVDFSRIPVFIEATDTMTEDWLLRLARMLTTHAYRLDSARRRQLHLSAVFACNFANHCYALAETVLAGQDIPFEVLLPLIDETAAKVHALSPHEAQTGPAVRYDGNVMAAQEALLADLPRAREVYRLMSRSIHEDALQRTDSHETKNGNR